MLYTIIYNPRCSKSREALKILDKSGLKYEIREYLKNPLDAQEIRELQERLGVPVVDFIRKGEEAFKQAGLSKQSPDDEIIKAMIRHPKLIERPIVYTEVSAAIGRPPENIIEFIKKR